MSNSMEDNFFFPFRAILLRIEARDLLVGKKISLSEEFYVGEDDVPNEANRSELDLKIWLRRKRRS